MLTHFAVFHQNFVLLKFLMDKKIDFNIPNKNGVTPIMIAAYKGEV